MKFNFSPRDFVDFLGVIEKLKCNTRHSVTTSGREESVAEHSWRLATMAMLLSDEFPELDMAKVIKMCLIHDFGEAITGDIPAFLKTEEDSAIEENSVVDLIKSLPDKQRQELTLLFDEMNEHQTPEAKLYKALDNCEALIQHNEADISSWLPLEYDLQMTYGQENCQYFPYTMELRDILKQDSLKKIEEKGKT